MPSDRAPVVVAAIATARIFVVKAPGPATEQAAVTPPPPNGTEDFPSDTSQPDGSQPGSSPPDTTQAGTLPSSYPIGALTERWARR
jgi:hypothetical protein